MKAKIGLARQQLTDRGLAAKYSPAAAEGHSVEVAILKLS